jgi:hypothetical protein
MKTASEELRRKRHRELTKIYFDDFAAMSGDKQARPPQGSRGISHIKKARPPG